ncbi:uncharacterized protein LOC131648458 [Vicia villosa]|uniref:uncharacterized protein LOC131648458 n=1 Tax=Vicia villosa TaxID=3911 RepID=UPI00273B50CF|nr:uncharacterized protein LOC131648458 [Vicia villosa]
MTKAKRRVGRPKSTAAAPPGSTGAKTDNHEAREQPEIPMLEKEAVIETTMKGGKSTETTKPPVQEKGTTKPWVEILQGNRNLNRGMQVEFVATQFFEGNEKVIIEAEDVAEELNYWENAIILFALGETLSMHAVKNFMEKSWNFVAMPELYFNESGYFVVRFKSHEDMSQVMEQGPYFIYGKPLFLKYWTIDFELKADLLRVLPLWITLPNLPLHLWGKKSISKITSAIGMPITTDECTARKLRISYARVLVEVDITKPAKESVTIKDHNGREWVQRVEYEWRPKYCHQCLKIGHDCEAKKAGGQPIPLQKVWQPRKKPPEVVSEGKQLESIIEGPEMEGISTETPKEPWQVVGSSKSDKAKKKIVFTPELMAVQNVFTPLGIGVVLGEGSSGCK